MLHLFACSPVVNIASLQLELAYWSYLAEENFMWMNMLTNLSLTCALADPEHSIFTFEFILTWYCGVGERGELKQFLSWG